MALSSPVFLALLGAIVVYFHKIVEARIGALHTTQAIAITGEAVRAAEELGRTHGLDGAQKYREAADRSAAYLNDHGIALSGEQLRTLIQGAVQTVRQANAAANAGPGVVLIGDSPTIVTAPPVPSGPSPEQVIAAITTALAGVYPGTPQAAPTPAPPVPVAAIAVQTVPLAAPTS